MTRTYQGKFRPENPSKYKGDPTNIIYRSSWELRFMRYLDKHPNVVSWSSEEFFIIYRSPIDNKIHRYFPDFFVKLINKDGKEETLVVEIKPLYQTVPPEKKNKVTRTYLNEVRTYGINSAKWKAAEEFCKDRGWQFRIMTERELGIK